MSCNLQSLQSTFIACTLHPRRMNQISYYNDQTHFFTPVLRDPCASRESIATELLTNDLKTSLDLVQIAQSRRPVTHPCNHLKSFSRSHSDPSCTINQAEETQTVVERRMQCARKGLHVNYCKSMHPSQHLHADPDLAIVCQATEKPPVRWNFEGGMANDISQAHLATLKPKHAWAWRMPRKFSSLMSLHHFRSSQGPSQDSFPIPFHCFTTFFPRCIPWNVQNSFWSPASDRN